MLAGFDFSLGGLAWLILVAAVLIGKRSRRALVDAVEELPGFIRRLRHFKGLGIEADVDRGTEPEVQVQVPSQQLEPSGRSLEDLLHTDLNQEGGSVLRTLWEHERTHFPEGGRTWLMFVPQGSPVKGEWNRGFLNTMILGYTGLFNQSFVGLTDAGREKAAELASEQSSVWRDARDLYYNGAPFNRGAGG